MNMNRLGEFRGNDSMRDFKRFPCCGHDHRWSPGASKWFCTDRNCRCVASSLDELKEIGRVAPGGGAILALRCLQLTSRAGTPHSTEGPMHHVLFSPENGQDEVVVRSEAEMASAFSPAERALLAAGGSVQRGGGRYTDMRAATRLLLEARSSGLPDDYLSECDDIRRRLWESGREPRACAALSDALAELTRLRETLSPKVEE